MVHVKDKLKYTKWVIRSRKSKKYRKRNEQKKKDNRAIKNTSQKTKDYESQKISKILNFALITQINKYFQSRSTLHEDKIRMYFIWLKYCMSKIKPTIHF
jgi:glutamate synthase domain-containing protein 3